MTMKPESDYFRAFIRAMLAFFETGNSPVHPDETIAIMTIIEYGRLAAQQPYVWIALPALGTDLS